MINLFIIIYLIVIICKQIKNIINLINSNLIINFIFFVIIFVVLEVFSIYIASWLNRTKKIKEKLLNKSKFIKLIFVLLKIIIVMLFFFMIIMIIKKFFLKNLFSIALFYALVPIFSDSDNPSIVLNSTNDKLECCCIIFERIMIGFFIPFILVNIIYNILFSNIVPNFENINSANHYVIIISVCIILVYVVLNSILKSVFKCLIKNNCKVFESIDYSVFSSVFFCSILVSILQVLNYQNVISTMINITHNDPNYIGSHLYISEYFLQKLINMINVLIIYYSERKNITNFLLTNVIQEDSIKINRTEENKSV